MGSVCRVQFGSVRAGTLGIFPSSPGTIALVFNLNEIVEALSLSGFEVQILPHICFLIYHAEIC